MTNSQRLATVREHLRRWLCDHNGPDDGTASNDGPEPEISSESILIRDGFYSGRTFEAVSRGNVFQATWFMEPDELKIRSVQGDVLAVFKGDEIGAVEEVEVVQITVNAPTEQPTISIPLIAGPVNMTAEKDGDNDGQQQISKAA